jgi:hypothetical protein
VTKRYLPHDVEHHVPVDAGDWQAVRPEHWNRRRRQKLLSSPGYGAAFFFFLVIISSYESISNKTVSLAHCAVLMLAMFRKPETVLSPTQASTEQS